MNLSLRLLLLLSAALFALAVFWPFGGAGSSAIAQARALAGSERVVMFTAPWCGYCDRLRDDLTREQVPFAEVNVESSSAAHDAWRSLGGRGVPLTLIDDAIVSGYAPDRIRALAAEPR